MMHVKMSDSYETAALNLEGSVNSPAVKEEHWAAAGYFQCRRHLKRHKQSSWIFSVSLPSIGHKVY